jgi:ParB/RepB/Spo0J family partition protein
MPGQFDLSLATTVISLSRIQVERDSRQRQENIADIEDLKASIKTVGLLNPLIVRTQIDDEGNQRLVLVAGERRYRALTELGWENAPIRHFENLSPVDAEVVELEENIKRKDLTWRDQVRAIGRLHSLKKDGDSKWKVEQTADLVNLAHTQMRKILRVYGALSSDKLAAAQGIEQAFNILQRFAERKAESIVSDIIASGGKAFGETEGSLSEGISFANLLDESQTVAAADDDGTFTATHAVTILDESGAISTRDAESFITPPPAVQTTAKIASPPPPPVICADFCEWVKTYEGPKFSLIHCDFPYGNYKGDDSKGAMSGLDTEEFYDNTTDVYWKLLDALTANLDKIMSYSAHMVFWFNMNFYTETVSRLRRTGLMVHDHPLVWHKTGGPGGLGVVPGTAVTYPRRTYDTALLAVRGGRPLSKPGLNSYAAPTAGNKIHPSQKPEPMLRHFLSMVVDETTTVFDPTCGSAAALRASEDLGARYVLGLELDENYAKAANTKTLQARVLRAAGSIKHGE